MTTPIFVLFICLYKKTVVTSAVRISLHIPHAYTVLVNSIELNSGTSVEQLSVKESRAEPI